MNVSSELGHRRKRTKNKPTPGELQESIFCIYLKKNLSVEQLLIERYFFLFFFTRWAFLFSPSVCSRAEFSSWFLAPLVKRVLLDKVVLSITWACWTPHGWRRGIFAKCLCSKMTRYGKCLSLVVNLFQLMKQKCMRRVGVKVFLFFNTSSGLCGGAKLEGGAVYCHTVERHGVQGGGMLKGPGVSPSQVRTVDSKPPPSCSLHRTGCFDSPPTHAHAAGAALGQVASAAAKSATVLSVCSQKQLPVIQFFPLERGGQVSPSLNRVSAAVCHICR